MALFESSEQRKKRDDILYETGVHELINDNELWEEPEEMQFNVALENTLADFFEEYCEQGSHGRHKSVFLVVIALEHGVEIDEDIMDIARSNVRFLEQPFQKADFKARLEEYEPKRSGKGMNILGAGREIGAEEAQKGRESLEKLEKGKAREEVAGATATTSWVIE